MSPKKSISESTWHLAGLVEAAETLGLGFWVVFSSTGAFGQLSRPQAGQICQAVTAARDSDDNTVPLPMFV